jgi:hypothetical protein
MIVIVIKHISRFKKYEVIALIWPQLFIIDGKLIHIKINKIQ